MYITNVHINITDLHVLMHIIDIYKHSGGMISVMGILNGIRNLS